MYKSFLPFCITFVPLITHSADSTLPTALLHFRDKPGTYKIRVQSVKDLIRQPDKKAAQYTILNTEEHVVEQVHALHIFQKLIELPDDAQYIRISIRKIIRNCPHGGGYTFVDAEKLRELAKALYDFKTLQCTISIEEQFQRLAQGDSKGCTIEVAGRLE